MDGAGLEQDTRQTGPGLHACPLYRPTVRPRVQWTCCSADMLVGVREGVCPALHSSPEQPEGKKRIRPCAVLGSEE